VKRCCAMLPPASPAQALRKPVCRGRYVAQPRRAYAVGVRRKRVRAFTRRRYGSASVCRTRCRERLYATPRAVVALFARWCCRQHRAPVRQRVCRVFSKHASRCIRTVHDPPRAPTDVASAFISAARCRRKANCRAANRVSCTPVYATTSDDATFNERNQRQRQKRTIGQGAVYQTA